MASTEFITKRLNGKKAELEKLTKKLQRIQKAQATNWEVNPYYYHESDLKYTNRDIENCKEAIAKYEADLAASIEKDNSRNVEAILTFLEGWKQRMTEFYSKKVAEYPEARKQYSEDMKFWNEITYFNRRKMEKESPEQYKELKSRKERIEARFQNEFGFLAHYMVGYTFEWDRFNKDLENEANRKYDFIIERTNAIVGQITDASHLEVGAKGDLNGYIIGTKGTAKVQTIGAGGYNIQCFHFRTLINKMK